MSLTPLKRGFLPTSTPIQSLADSGYFGSDNKPLHAKVVHTLSPVKEYSPSKKRYTELIQLGRTYSLETPQIPKCVRLGETQYTPNELAKELNFNDLSDFSESLHDSGNFDKGVRFPAFYLPEFSSPKAGLKSKDESRKLDYDCSRTPNVDVLFSPIIGDNGEKRSAKCKVDFFEELGRRNCDLILSSILSYMPPENLCRICCVSKSWKSIVVHNTKANSRREEYLREERAQKENNPRKTSLEVNDTTKEILAGERKTVLCDVVNTTTFKQPLEKTTSRFDSFIKEGQNMKSGSLMKCPSCLYPARKSDGRDEFCCTKCNYTFCRSCLNPYLKNHVCHQVKVSIVIGSKRSKKSLKRL